MPLFNAAFKLVLMTSKQSYITSQNITSFLKSPSAWVFVLTLLITLALFLFTKVSSLTYYCNTEGMIKLSRIHHILTFGLQNVYRNLRKGNIALLFFTLPFYIYTCLPLIIGVMIQFDIGHLRNSQALLYKGTLILGFLLISFFCIPGVFALNYCIKEGCRFIDGLQKVRSALKGNYKKILFSYLRSNLILFIAYLLFYYTLLFLVSFVVYLFSARVLAVAVFLTTYPVINLYATLLFSMITFVYNVNLSTTQFHDYMEIAGHGTLDEIKIPSRPRQSRTKRQLILLNTTFICLFLASLLNFYLTLHNSSLAISDAFQGTQISSHRGNSHIAPENTIPALEQAIIAESDYAEIDIRQTKDHILVLMHDSNLKRTSGVNQYLSNMTYTQLNELDVGSWFGKDFLNTKIPTLEETLEHCKGRIKLNIELKISGAETDVEQQLVDLIVKYNFEDQCVISSSKYSSLIKIKEINQNIKTGYILSAVYGNFYSTEYLDFFSIRSNYINKSVVDNVHAAGKEIYAWTVNNTSELLRMKSLGVDCIITDNPTHAREIIYRDNTNATFIQLIKQMFNTRSNYQATQFIKY
jgi:glycerophosphoryl diester phosphodiesterase